MLSDGPLLEINDLVVDYAGKSGFVRAVDGVSLRVSRGEFLGLVGESACGKSTLLFAASRLLSESAQIVGGNVIFKGRDLVVLREKQLRHLRWRELSVVMQSAMNALNPVLSIEAQMLDAIKAHQRMSKRAARARAAEVLRLVGIDEVHLK
ncbi:MAG TPA: ATP-binding cassette domain-containing protein, partial [Chloroflexota bacterium]|nr:ATP-binding cassette domain-containing protein [Chloroflexota bacterium]